MDLPTPSPSDQSPEPPDSSMCSLHPDNSRSAGMDDLLLSPIFLFPGEDTSTSSSSGSSSQHSESPRNDWALSGAMWTQCSDSKPQDDLTSLGLNFAHGLTDHWSSMNMDTDISAFMSDQPQRLSIDSNALHFESALYDGSHGLPTAGNCESLFQFTLSQPSDTTQASIPPFQLPTPKPGSMSSRSVSPTISGAEQGSNTGVNPSDLSLLTQLGQKARDASGVMLAVPAQQGPRPPVASVSSASTDSQDVAAKVPIPRLRHLEAAGPQSSQFNVNPMVHSTPAPSQPVSSSPIVSQDTSAAAPTKSGRPKTSHTTIERRYRTNLNARILALRRAVPALRILEKNAANQTQGKGLTGASGGKWDFGEFRTAPTLVTGGTDVGVADDVVNARGYVDGVKAAKKNSKGVVLGKAVEYIKSLKRRELRLKRESDGLRALLSGLVGGPELLREWEREWRERFGGEEADEVDEDADENEEGDDGEGDDGEDGYSDDEDGRAKKRTRVEKKERKQPEPAEKRKRGRPRKNPAPVPDAPRLVLQPSEVPDQRQPSKYLLAAFMFFSFFNPHAPTASPTGTGHEGTVLTHTQPDASSAIVNSGGWSVMQAIHVLVSVLLFVSLAAAYLPKRLTHLLPNALLFASPASTSTRSSSPMQAKKKVDKRSVPTTPIPSVLVSRGAAIADALTAGDEQALRDVLGADCSVFSVVKGATFAGCRALWIRRRTRIHPLTRQEEVELRGWRRLAQLEVVRGENSSLLSRVQIYLSFSARLLSSKVSPTDNITLALLAHSFAPSTAAELWETARRVEAKTSAETLVLEMDIENVARIIALALRETLSEDSNTESPVHHIAAYVVLIRAKALAAHNFVSSVMGPRIVDVDSESGGDPTHNADTKIVVAAGRELGGILYTLMSLLDKIERCPAAEVLAGLPPLDFEVDVDSSDSSSEGDCLSIDTQPNEIAKDVRVLLVATLLYRRIFHAEEKDAASTHVPSPLPSPTPDSAALHLALRRALASAAFDASLETEDARDRVVDMLGETRRGRWGY